MRTIFEVRCNKKIYNNRIDNKQKSTNLRKCLATGILQTNIFQQPNRRDGKNFNQNSSFSFINFRGYVRARSVATHKLTRSIVKIEVFAHTISLHRCRIVRNVSTG